ncbi:DUF6895 family protein [Streptomyces sp. NPDC090106]|uniref:DUF6895 family protein n=1 Tax=Streptomyces sp. NPDC090106 TaxID=3365946 RepID=UPI0038178E66
MTTATTASPAVLHHVGERALDWLDAQRDHFRLTDHDRATNLALGERLKPIGELGINMRVLFREGLAGSRQRERGGALLDFAWRELLDGGALLADIQRSEPLSPVPMEVYAPFYECGYRNLALEEALAVPRRLRSWAALEVLPNRQMALRAAERRIGLTEGGDVRENLARTWLGQLPEPWTLQMDTAYNLTHTVFHLSNWGEAPSRIPSHVSDYLTQWLPAWIDEWAQREHWDLLGELLVVDACLPTPALDADIWERFAAAQAPSGAMPIQYGMPEGDPGDVFDLVHHPTLVAAFASAMATSRALS